MTTTKWLPVRVLPVLVTAADLAVLHGPVPVTSLDWVLGLTAAVLTGAGAWLPLTTTVAQSALLLATAGGAVQAAMPVMFVLTMITLGELWIRRGRWPALCGTAAFVAAQLWLYAPAFDPLLTPTSLLLTAAPPVLLGLYIRSVLGVALEADRRREEAVLAARVAERTAIARELHDLMAHHLASVAVQVGAARHALHGSDARVDEALAQAHATTRAGLGDLKRLMTVLRDPAATTEGNAAGASLADEDGLPAALTAVVERTRAAGVALDAEIDPAVAGLDSIRRLAVLRVVQEGLTNVVKHGGPHATLTVRAADDATRIAVTDDGTGASSGAPGFGLVGMRERVELLGGHVIASGRNGGWSLRVTIPGGES
ncbi:sensor histidine kinase [Amycolatopsis magusensis]|uniref:sensor histidine kinase n=1 Tax=Amycolatopsis magusensis TaxID=882444 RepID=UPI0024A8B32D|nr:histidine kinase [Amycolatopsis magusensis]MDI5979195.1 histidine kinase [Amycolatopsis magusensis]